MNEKEKALNQARKDYLKKQLFSGVGLIFLVFGAAIVISTVDALFVHSDTFRYLSCGVTGLYLGISSSINSRKRFEAYIEECKKILK